MAEMHGSFGAFLGDKRAVLFRDNLMGAALGGVVAFACVSAVAGPLVVGSGNEAVIEPTVTVPDETPCVVPLLTGATFGADAVSYTYSPPSACPGPAASPCRARPCSPRRPRSPGRRR